MKTVYESSYENILKECVALMERVTQAEQGKISLVLEIGKKIDHLVTGREDGNATIKKLARDIFKARGKLIPPSELCEYHQLYLNFSGMENVKKIADKSLNDISVDMLLKISDHPKDADKVSDGNRVDRLLPLTKAMKLLERFDIKLEDEQFSGEELTMAERSLEVIRNKVDSLLNSINKYGAKSQMDIFMPDGRCPIMMTKERG